MNPRALHPIMARTWLLGLLASVSSGCATPPPPPLAEVPETAPAGHLGKGDLIEVKVFREPELAGIYRVRESGFDFPLIGQVPSLGRTEEEVAEEIRDRLADGFIKDPKVQVLVKQRMEQGKIHVLGQVTKTGSFSFETGMSIIQAITNAGGFTKLARPNAVVVTRVEDGQEKRLVIPVGEIREGNAPNFQLKTGDIIYVPEALF